MSSFITVTRFNTSSKSSNNMENHITVQNGTPNFTSLSPFKYKEYSIDTKNIDKEFKINYKQIPNKAHQITMQKNEPDDFKAQKIYFPLTKNGDAPAAHSSENESINDNSTKNVIVPNLYENNSQNTNKNNQPAQKIKIKSSFKKELKLQINRVVTPTRRRSSNQKGLHKPNDSNSLEENHVVNTFKNISKSKSKVFDNAQRIRYKKTIQNYEKIENYKDKMIEFESEKITARFSPTKNTEFDSAQSANPILTSSQWSQKQIKYYFCPSHINNTSKVKGFNGSVNYDRGITEAVAEVRRDRLKTDFLYQY